ncbi:MAG: efflux RND transporter periplasmic adaptor subunit [Myxococcales bacterium]
MTPEANSPAATVVKRGSARWMLLLLALVAGTAVVYSRARGRGLQQDGDSKAAASASTERPVPVVLINVERKDVPVYLEGLGNVAAFYSVIIRPQVDGKLDRVLFREGQTVKKGELLAQIDPRPFSIQAQQARAAVLRDTANLRNAQRNLERFVALQKDNLVPQQQVDDQRAQVDQLDAQVQADRTQVASAALNLDYARVTAPFDGVVGVRLVDPGNLVRANDATGIAVITQIDPIAVLFTLPQDDLPAVQRAMDTGPPLAVEAFTRDGGEKLAQGELRVIDNAINPQTATARLKAVFPNPARALWPNQFVKARLRIATRKGAVVIPAPAVQLGPQGSFAYVVGTDDVAMPRPIVVSDIVGELAIVASGLEMGERVVVDGQSRLRPGSKVSARPVASARVRP